MNEQRVFQRFSARLPVKFQHSANEFGIDVFLRDISASGAKVTTKQRLFQNDRVALQVKLPEGNNPLTLTSQVVWLKDTQGGFWEVGLRFLEIDFMKIQRIYKLVLPEMISLN